MHIPINFEKQLNREFQNRFRIRWSKKREEFQIEQKISLSQVLEPPLLSNGTWDSWDDDYIRSRDGYWYVMSVRQGDRMPCQKCRTTMKVPILKTAESICPSCNKRHRAAFYPLDDLLIRHLKWIDPLTDGPKRVTRMALRKNRKAQLSRENTAYGEVESAASHNFNRLFDIQSVGYTGKEF